MLQVYLTNLGLYNEGELRGEWVDLPVSFADFTAVLERIGIDGVEYEEYFITDYDCDVSGVTEHLGEYENLEALNYLASKLDDLREYQVDLLEAALELGEHGDDVYELIELIDGMEDNYDFLPGVDDDDALGTYWVEESGCYDTESLGPLHNYIDYERFGRDIRYDEGGTYTDHGYICCRGGSWTTFDPDDIPDEYRLRPNDDEGGTEDEQTPA